MKKTIILTIAFIITITAFYTMLNKKEDLGARTNSVWKRVAGVLSPASPGDSVSITATTTIANLNITPTNNTGSGDTNGAVYIDNTSNTDTALGIYSNIGATSNNHLMSIRADNSSFNQDVLFIRNDGSGKGVYLQNNNGGVGLNISQYDSGVPLYIDNSRPGFGGSIIIEDTDGAGCTQITTLNGVITASIITCP